MNENDLIELLDALRELHAVAPDFRFGQLVCNMATLAGGTEIVFAPDVGDDDLLAAARRFLESHRRLGREARVMDDRWPELLDKVRRLGEEYPGVRFGEMVGHLATAVRGPEMGAMWDVEDDELIAVADRWLAHRMAQHAAESELRRIARALELQRSHDAASNADEGIA